MLKTIEKIDPDGDYNVQVVFLEAVLMGNDELISNGKSLGFSKKQRVAGNLCKDNIYIEKKE